jgi:hypothetical protein
VPMIRKINPHPSYLWVPTVVQFMGIAEAGQQKSTLLGEIAPLVKKALDRDGADDRRALVNQWRMEEMKKAEQLGLKVDANAPDWIKVFEGGLCQSSYASTGTPEGFRDWQVENGGHRVILTAEPDILREVSAYAGGAGPARSTTSWGAGTRRTSPRTARGRRTCSSGSPACRS